MIPTHTHTLARIIRWLLEDASYGDGRGCPQAGPVIHDDLEAIGLTDELVGDLLKEPWVCTSPNRMWATDRDALLGWLVEHGILSEEQRMWLDARDALALMEG